tara:strand:+ start:5814 stop:7124 length:1311 start_codon:yes stop_codon:yes gene_type:complete
VFNLLLKLQLNNILKIIYLILLISFLYGFLAFIGIPTIIPKLLITILSLILFHFTYEFSLSRDKKFKFILINYFIFYSFIVLVSILYNSSDLFKSFSFYHYSLVGYLLLIVLYNVDFNNLEINKILNFINKLFILQIIFTIFKYVIYGQKETLIGTISLTSGNLNTILPLIGIFYYLSNYLFIKKSNVFLFLALGMFFISYVGEKRAIFFILPLCLSIFYLFYSKYHLKKSFMSKNLNRFLISITILSLVFIYFGVKFNPTLNPENIKGGSFDLAFLADYLIKYNFNINSPLASGRFAGLYVIISQLSLFDYKYLIGNGPDTLIGFTDSVGFGPLRNFGLLSAMSANGLVSYLISVGILGSLSFFLFYYNIFYKIIIKMTLPKSNFNRFLDFFSIMLLMVFFFDFLIYSKGFINNHAISSLFFILIGITLKKNNCE